MKAEDLQPLVIIDKSDVIAKRFNDLLEIVQRQEKIIRHLQIKSGRCNCMNCMVVGIMKDVVIQLLETLDSVTDVHMPDGMPCWCLNDGYWNGSHTETCLDARKVFVTITEKMNEV